MNISIYLKIVVLPFLCQRCIPQEPHFHCDVVGCQQSKWNLNTPMWLCGLQGEIKCDFLSDCKTISSPYKLDDWGSNHLLYHHESFDVRAYSSSHVPSSCDRVKLYG